MIEEFEYTSLQQFLKAISPASNPQLTEPYSNFAFRGQGNSKWKTFPSSLRPEFLRKQASKSKTDRFTNRDQIDWEVATLQNFVLELNEHGHHIPFGEDFLEFDITADKANDLVTRWGRGEELWPPIRYHSAIGIAQHHGLQTRLLDFSADPYVAAYFAAFQAKQEIQQGRKPTHLTVMAVNTLSKLSNLDYNQATNLKGVAYQVVKTPFSQNANLKAQRALFLAYIQVGFRANDNIMPVSLEAFFDSDYPHQIDHHSQIEFSGLRHVMYKYHLKINNLDKLFKYLHLKFYTHAHLFPGISSCVVSMHNKMALNLYPERY